MNVIFEFQYWYFNLILQKTAFILFYTLLYTDIRRGRWIAMRQEQQLLSTSKVALYSKVLGLKAQYIYDIYCIIFTELNIWKSVQVRLNFTEDKKKIPSR